MDVQQLIGRYLRLRHELAIVLAQMPRQLDRTQRLATDVAAAREALRQAGAVDEQTDDGLGFAVSAFLPPESQFGTEDAPLPNGGR